MDTIHYKLTSCPLFTGLGNEEIKILLDGVTHHTKKYRKDNLIAQNGDECRSLLIVAEGSVKGEMMDFTGKTIKIEDIESPRPLAPAFLFGKNNQYPVTIVANNDTTILVIPKTSLIKMLQSSEIVLQNFMNQISNRAQFLTNKIRFLSFQTIKGKLAHYILQLSKNQGSEIVLDKSQNELAGFFGVARPSLGRSIRELDNEGLIKAEGRQIKILNREGLSGLLK